MCGHLKFFYGISFSTNCFLCFRCIVAATGNNNAQTRIQRMMVYLNAEREEFGERQRDQEVHRHPALTKLSANVPVVDAIWLFPWDFIINHRYDNVANKLK